MSNEQRDTKLIFKHSNLAAESWLCNPQTIRCLTEAAELRDADYGSELRKFHRDRILA